MKKLLLLAYDFPPYVSVGGLRPYAWYKHFHEFDIYPIVVTRQWENKYGNHLDYIAPSKTKETIIEESDKGIIIRTPYKANLANKIMLKYGENKYKFIRKFISAFYELFQWIFFVGSKSGLYFGAKQYLKENKVDCIIATGDPFILFKYASKLSKKHKIPWIADYRDPWTENRKAFFIRTITLYLEKHINKSATAIITVSEFITRQINTNKANKKVLIMPNGYNDSAEIVKDIPQNNTKLTIALAGTISTFHPINKFLRDFSEYMANNPKAEIIIKFYGINIIKKHEIEDSILNEYKNIKNNIVFIPTMPNELLVKELVEANLFLLFNSYVSTGTKIFEYLALKRKILFCYENNKESEQLYIQHYGHNNVKNSTVMNSQVLILKETNSGIIVKNSSHLPQVLDELLKEFKEKREIVCNSINVENYSRKKQTQKLSEIIKNIKN